MSLLFRCLLLCAVGSACACGERVPEATPASNAPSADRPANAGEPQAKPIDADERVSRFSPLTVEACRLVEENREEGGWWKRSCGGVAGYRLEWTESDLRQGLTILAPDGSRGDPRLSDVVAKGAFNSLGQTIEWRGPKDANPDALIVRMNVAHGAEPQRPDISNLAVVRLGAPACVIAAAPPGPRQNERARQLADGDLSACIRR